MGYRKADIKRIAAQLRRMKERGRSTALFLGAGISKSAGVPLASEIVQMIETDEQYKYRLTDAMVAAPSERKYSDYMNALSPSDTKEFFRKCIGEAKINLAHLFIASLVKHGYVDSVLTTNFDPLLIKSLFFLNEFPAIYDIATAKRVVPDSLVFPNLIYLHGQNNGFVLLNTEEELTEPIAQIRKILQHCLSNHTMIVCGYSGVNDRVFNELADMGEYSNDLYWVGYKDAEPAEQIIKGVLSPQHKSGYWVPGHDADSFFRALNNELELGLPDIISKPFTHLKNLYEHFGDSVVEGKDIKIYDEGRSKIDQAIQTFEIDKVKSTDAEAELLQKIKEAVLTDDYSLIDELRTQVLKTDNAEVREYFGYLLSDHSLQFSDEKGLALVSEASGFAPESAVVINNWGTALSGLARQANDAEMFRQSFEKYQRATELKNDYSLAFYNWGTALSNLAGLDKDDALYKQSFEKYQRAAELDPADASILNNWGVAIYELAGLYEDEALYRQATEKYAQAVAIKPDYSTAFNNWGTALCDLGNLMEDDNLRRQSFDKYQKATELKPDYSNAFYNWAVALSELARATKDESLYRQAFEKYRKAGELRPDDGDVLKGWGLKLIELGKLTGNKQHFETAIEKFVALNELSAHQGDYDLSYTYSLLENKDKAMNFLESVLRHDPPPSRDYIDDDEDFIFLRQSPEYDTLLKQYFP